MMNSLLIKGRLLKLSFILICTLLIAGCWGGGGGGGGSSSSSIDELASPGPLALLVEEIGEEENPEENPENLNNENPHTPEPSTVTLLGIGLSGVALRMWMKRKKARM